jgi:two-component system response regulator (stage 0 sporulation protein F)
MEDSHETKTILLVDVHEAFLTMLTKEFKEEGYQTLTARSGLEALRVLEENPDLDLIITDLHLHEMDGADLLRQIKERWPGLPVIIHTAYTQYKENFLTWAADDYIVKSLDFSDLNNSVKKLIGKRSKP